MLRRWNIWRLKAAGVQFGKHIVLEGSVRLSGRGKVVLGDHVRLGDGVYLMVWPDATLQIGSHSYLGRGSTVLCYERVEIGDNCLLAPYTYITDVNHGFEAGQLIRQQAYSAKPVHIGDDVWFGVAVKVMPGATVGDGAVIGAGAVITGDIELQSIAVGVPAREVRKRAASN